MELVRGYHWHDFEWLTEQQAVVLDLMCEGYRPRQIATQLGKSYCYVRDTVSAARFRTDSKTVMQLIARYVRKRDSLPEPKRLRVFAKGEVA